LIAADLVPIGITLAVSASLSAASDNNLLTSGSEYAMGEQSILVSTMPRVF
jgi:hypothetical protein